MTLESLISHCHSSYPLVNLKVDAYTKMSRNGKGLRLGLKLDTSARGNTSRRTSRDDDDDNVSPNSSSSPSSCVSSEAGNSPEASSSMVLAGCPRCLMYVMLAEEDPRCPKCKSTVLLDFLNNNNGSGGDKKNKNKNKKS